MRSFFTSNILIAIGLACLTDPSQAEPKRRGVLPSSVMAIDTFTAPATQLAAQLLARTQPGYYSNQVVVDAHLTATCSADLCGKTNSPLPVKLINFSGQRLDATQVQLNWTTSAEINNDYFQIQRSLNPAAGFEAIGSVKSIGNSDKNITYQFADPNLETGYTYYRLKQVDFDGRFNYSSIIAVKGYQQNLLVKAFPNPGHSKELAFRVEGELTREPLSVRVFDGRGVLLYQNLNYMLDGNSRITLPSLPGLRAGLYYIKVATSQQQATATFIIVP